jgi:hypothetical protein
MQKSTISNNHPGAGVDDTCLYMQVNKERVEEYAQNFKSLWDLKPGFRGDISVIPLLTYL